MTLSDGNPQMAQCGPKTAEVVRVQLSQLQDTTVDLAGALGQALSSQGLGVICVDMTAEPAFTAARKRLLKLAHALGGLDAVTLSKLEDPSSQYNFGWSCGKEALSTGEFDVSKGSFYANPCLDDPASGDELLSAEYPVYFRPNLWPGQALPDLEPAFKELGQIIYKTGLCLAEHCDRYLAKQYPDKRCTSIKDIITSSRNHKARLLHYFPQSRSCGRQSDSASTLQTHQSGPAALEESYVLDNRVSASGLSDPGVGSLSTDVVHDQPWCGWHTDHGSLTGLTCAMYVDEEGRDISSPDPNAGLYVRDRSGQVVKINIPHDHLAFQVGEALQVHSGGELMATPHYVRAVQGSEGHSISRNTFAVFMQPDVTCHMDAPPGVLEKAVQVGQWRPGQTFGMFSSATIHEYYKT